MLEEWDHAVARGAHIRAEVVGYGATADAYHITAPAPDGSGAIRAMQIALEQAGLAPCDVNYINAHGTSTEWAISPRPTPSSACSAVAFRPVSSTKSMMGHMLGGAGAAEAAVCVLAMENGLIPPTINLTDPDPQCDLDYVPLVARKADLAVTMSNSFGFGGHNAALIFARV